MKYVAIALAALCAIALAAGSNTRPQRPVTTPELSLRICGF